LFDFAMLSSITTLPGDRCRRSEDVPVHAVFHACGL